MNALPLNNRVSPQVALDRLIADYGLRRVALALIARLFHRSRPPDRHRGRVHDTADIPDYLRRDLGLTPRAPRSTMYDLSYLDRTRFR